MADPVPVPGPDHLMVDLQARPVGVGRDAARLGWRLPATVVRQLGHQIQVSTDPQHFTGSALVWDSGRRDGAASTAVRAGGLGLDPSSVYWWRVRVWSVGFPDATAWSGPARFVTAVDPGWPAAAVWAPAGEAAGEDDGDPAADEAAVDDPADQGVGLPSWALLRREFELPAGEVHAAFVEAVGDSPVGARQYVYKLWCNEQVVGRGSVRPLAGEVRYQTHDLAGVLRPGEVNALAALCWAEQGRRFAAQLVVVYADGRRFTTATSPQWRGLDGTAMLPGEDRLEGGWYRAPREHWHAPAVPVGWTAPGYDDSGWARVVERPGVEHPRPARVEIEQTDLRPAAVGPLGDGRWLIDLGRVVVGGLRLSVRAAAGDRVRVVLGEELTEGRVRSPLRGGNVYDETWTLRAGEQQIEHWGYRGFRYAELSTAAGLDLADAVTAVCLTSTDLATEATFDCSDEDLVRVWQLCRDTVEATALDLYQDTPTRERGPYEGDQYVNQLGQHALGGGYALARYSHRYLTHQPTWPVEYRLMAPLCAWEDYLVTGDPDHLAEGWDHWTGRTLERWLDDLGLVRKPPDPGGETHVEDLVDWPRSNRDDYELTDVNTVVNSFQWAAWDRLAAIAEVIGRTEDAPRLSRRAEELRAAVNQHLLDPERARYRDGLATDHSAQHATAVPLALGLAPPELRAGLGETLAGQGVRTSIYAVQLLLDALYAAGEDVAACRVMTSRDRPGWIDLMDRLGATLTPEAWDPDLKPNMSFCHAWGSAPLNVVQRHLVGLTVLEPGAAHVRIRPQPGPLDWFRARVPTVRGVVGIAWDRRPGRAGCTISLPGNMTAELELAASVPSAVTSSAVGCGAPTLLADGRLRWGTLSAGTTVIRLADRPAD